MTTQYEIRDLIDEWRIRLQYAWRALCGDYPINYRDQWLCEEHAKEVFRD